LSVTGREFRFQRLVLATGARARRLAVPGAELRGVVGLNDAKDAQALAALLPAAQRVVVVGGGYLGLEAAASCQRLGKSVTVVEAAPRLLGRVVAPVVADFFRDAHVRRGTQIRLSSEVVQFEGRNGAVERVVLSDGSVLPADVVIVSIGVEPRTELAEHLGLRTIDGAVLVDSYAVTSDPRVLAVGDCTATPNPLREEERVRIPSVQNAVDQGKVAAATLAGTPVAYRAVPWFWSDQYDLKLRIAGLSAGFDDLVVRGEPASEKFAAFYFRGDRLIAADFINRPGEFMLVKRWLAQGFNGHQDLIGDAHVPLTDERLKSSPALS
jgi:3-phenylpropionate/trans-cinnamate dioxygenase ferredoxin reductase subunit